MGQNPCAMAVMVISFPPQISEQCSRIRYGGRMKDKNRTNSKKRFVIGMVMIMSEK